MNRDFYGSGFRNRSKRGMPVTYCSYWSATTKARPRFTVGFEHAMVYEGVYADPRKSSGNVDRSTLQRGATACCCLDVNDALDSD